MQAAALQGMQQSGVVFDANTGLYYDWATGFYFDPKTEVGRAMHIKILGKKCGVY